VSKAKAAALRNNFAQPPTNHSNVKCILTKHADPSDTFIYQIIHRERRGDNKCRRQIPKNLKHERN
jgi:hypothetical protein